MHCPSTSSAPQPPGRGSAEFQKFAVCVSWLSFLDSGHSAGFQNFTSSSLSTLWKVSWQPLVVQESLFDFKSLIIAVCVGLSSNERAPEWQCRHSRLL